MNTRANKAQRRPGLDGEATRARYSLDTYYLTKIAPLRQPQAAQEPQVYSNPYTTLVDDDLAYLLEDLGIMRPPAVYRLSQFQATCLLYSWVRDAWLDSMIRKAVSRA